jgi:putative ABC transport system substrate-binding protein
LKEIIPDLSRLALLADLDLPGHAALEIQYFTAAAKGNAVRLEVFAARDRNSIDEAFPKIVQSGCDAAVIAGQGTFYLLRDELSGAALSNRVPTMAPSGVFVSSGLLMSYGTIIRDRYRETVAYAVRILRGEKPIDLPVQFPTKFELAINLRTAKALGIMVPESFLLRADQVIE